jgi:hypothetical protein
MYIYIYMMNVSVKNFLHQDQYFLPYLNLIFESRPPIVFLALFRPTRLVGILKKSISNVRVYGVYPGDSFLYICQIIF